MTNAMDRVPEMVAASVNEEEVNAALADAVGSPYDQYSS